MVEKAAAELAWSLENGAGPAGCVLVYDTDGKTEWVLPRASVLLSMIRALIANGGYKLYRKGVETTLLYDAVDTNFSKVLLSALDFQICDDNQKSMGSVGEYIEEFLLRLAITEVKL